MPRRARPGFPQRSPPTSHVWKWPLAGTFSILRINIQPLDRTCSPYRFKRYSSMDRKSLQDPANPPHGEQVISARTSEQMRDLMRLGVVKGPGSKANANRSEERRLGKEWGSTGRSGWAQVN